MNVQTESPYSTASAAMTGSRNSSRIVKWNMGGSLIDWRFVFPN